MGGAAMGFEMKKVIFKIRVFLFWFWRIRMYPTSEKWSKRIGYLLAEGYTLKIIDEYSAELGPESLWIENYPYASFYRYRYPYIGHDRNLRFIPNWSTGYKLCMMLKKSKMDQYYKRQFERTI